MVPEAKSPLSQFRKKREREILCEARRPLISAFWWCASHIQKSSVGLKMGDQIGAFEDAKRASLLAPNFSQFQNFRTCSLQSSTS
ncbi:uncharacterized protein LOC122041073 isoform X8 [Zingiber officinale]|uniref:uncharacterized protein LOC122041073 isoform X8 n=1 Tax=Zingiber officinale TaxID=94328 RepID=UPI001C4AE90C|nr:uncharacterized protein LOC122041073 isoform X8 [Zingiber officinale]